MEKSSSFGARSRKIHGATFIATRARADGQTDGRPALCRGKIKFREKRARAIFPSQIYLPLLKRDENKRHSPKRSGVAAATSSSGRPARSRKRRINTNDRRRYDARACRTINPYARTFNPRDFSRANSSRAAHFDESPRVAASKQARNARATIRRSYLWSQSTK